MDGWIRDAVLMALASYNETLPDDLQIGLEGDPSLSELDSLAVTNLIVAVEAEVAAAGGVEISLIEISLTNEETLRLLQDPEQTPLRSLSTLCAHVARAVERARS
jgi:hypothetical protein